MTTAKLPWATAGLGDEALHALDTLPGARLTSFLLTLAERRARARGPADVLRQWQQDSFTAPAVVDLREQLRVELQLLDAAAAFEAITLSPLAPFAACAAVGPVSQNNIVTTMRGTEVVSDPTNVLALECAARLRRDPDRPVRLVTSQRVVRAQPIPRRPGYAHHFALLAMATAGRETEGHGFLVASLLEHIRTLLAGLDAVAADRPLGARSVRILATPARANLADGLGAALADHKVAVLREVLKHPYYDGLRFMIDVRTPSGDVVPIGDGGAFDWVARLTSNRRLVCVASGLGVQLLTVAFPRRAGA